MDFQQFSNYVNSKFSTFSYENFNFPAFTNQRRGFFGKYFEHKRLKALEMEAAKAPQDGMRQYQFMKELNKSYPEAVIHR